MIVKFSITVGAQSLDASHMEMDDSVAQATAALSWVRMAPSMLRRTWDAVSTLTLISKKNASAAASWDPLLQRIKLFTEIVDGISEVLCSPKFAAKRA
jgi:hypothetical protein